MGRQSSRIYFGGKDHKEIYFGGHYHDKAYIGKELVWEKNPGIFNIETVMSTRIPDSSSYGLTLIVIKGKIYLAPDHNAFGRHKVYYEYVDGQWVFKAMSGITEDAASEEGPFAVCGMICYIGGTGHYAQTKRAISEDFANWDTKTVVQVVGTWHDTVEYMGATLIGIHPGYAGSSGGHPGVNHYMYALKLSDGSVHMRYDEYGIALFDKEKWSYWQYEVHDGVLYAIKGWTSGNGFAIVKLDATIDENARDKVVLSEGAKVDGGYRGSKETKIMYSLRSVGGKLFNLISASSEHDSGLELRVMVDGRFEPVLKLPQIEDNTRYIHYIRSGPSHNRYMLRDLVYIAEKSLYVLFCKNIYYSRNGMDWEVQEIGETDLYGGSVYVPHDGIYVAGYHKLRKVTIR